MGTQDQESSAQGKLPFQLNNWYYLLVSILILLSLVTLDRNAAGEWEITLGIRETTPILVALAILPALLRFLVKETPERTELTAAIPNVLSFTIKKVQEVVDENQKVHRDAGEAAKDRTKKPGDVQEIQRAADADLENTVTPQDLPFVQRTYLQKLDELVKEFNRNRHDRASGKSTVAQADNIAYRMRSMAPLLFDQLSISTWLESPNPGKRLAAIKYLDWAQDIEYAGKLAARLQEVEHTGDTFQAYHILLALYSMADQLAYDYRDEVEC